MEFKKRAGQFLGYVLGYQAIKKNVALTLRDIQSLRSPKQEQEEKEETLTFDALMQESGVGELAIRRQYHWRYLAAWVFLTAMLSGLSIAFFAGYEKSGLILFCLSVPLYFQHMFIMTIIREKKQFTAIAFLKLTVQKALFLPRPLPYGWRLNEHREARS